MNNQKLENLLNLALETPEPVREKSLNLNVGYETESNTWELIVKYNGNLSGLLQYGIEVEELLAGYAVLTVPEGFVDVVGQLPEIEYVEKPKRLFFAVENGKAASCILPVTVREPFLSGRGVIVSVIDSGIDAANAHFRNADGTTRILYLWDQTIPADEASGRNPPEGFLLGTEFDREQINAALAAANTEEQFALLPSRDISGHGTAVAGIAAGSHVGSFEGVAPESDLIIVKLGMPREVSFPRTTELMRAVTYAVRKAQQMGMPISVNLSFGNTYGAHDGSSLLERFLDNAAEVGRTVISVGSGNEGNAAGHVQADREAPPAEAREVSDVRSGQETAVRTGVPVKTGEIVNVELAVAAYETAFNVQLWKNYTDRYRITLRSPGGEEQLLPADRTGKVSLRMERTDILIYIGQPTPYAVNQEIYFDFIPVDRYVTQGVWSFIIEAVESVTGQYYLYLPSAGVRNESTRFFAPSPQVTLTIPSTAQKVITVGAYNSIYESYADFSGRGYVYPERTLGLVAAGAVKPDLTAPGVDIAAPDTLGGYASFSGTSFATPFVAGAAALLMEWGIVQGNDPFLYGEKVKAYLRRGARPLRGEAEYPNDRVGFGALCVSESLPM